jgi:hypothetical protein
MTVFSRPPAKLLSLCVAVYDEPVLGETVRRVFYTEKAGSAPWANPREIPAADKRGFGDSLSCAYVKDSLALCATNADKHLIHSVRLGGRWTAFQDLTDETKQKDFVELACASVNDELHVCGVTQGGSLMHTIRHEPPWWSRKRTWWDEFENVARLAEDDPGEFEWVACAAVDGELNVLGVTRAGGSGLWHTLRHGDGSWDSFTDLRGSVGDPGQLATISCAATRNDFWPQNVFTVGALVARHGGWWPMLVSRAFDGRWERSFSDISVWDSSKACSDIALTGSGSDVDVLIFQYPTVQIWHGTQDAWRYWVTDQFAAPPTYQGRGRLAASVIPPRLSVLARVLTLLRRIRWPRG